MESSFGNRLRVTVYGESHGECIGVRMRGFPAGEAVDEDAVLSLMRRRAPGQDAFSTPRKEADLPKILSGIAGGVTTGEVIEAVIKNTDQHSADYAGTRDIPRPSHADLPARMKYGEGLDLRGGGHFSGRLTAPLCFAGALCLQYLARRGVFVGSHIAQIGEIHDERFDAVAVDRMTLERLQNQPFGVLSQEAGEKMKEEILKAKQEGDSVGGVIEVAAVGLPAGLGTPLYGGAESRLAANLFGIPAVKGVEFGEGFSAASMRGSEHNDPYDIDEETGRVRPLTNHAGGVLGAITTGMPLIFRIAVKPTPSIAKEQRSVDLRTGQPVTLKIKGRHDPCIVPRALPVAEAMTAITLTELFLEEEA